MSAVFRKNAAWKIITGAGEGEGSFRWAIGLHRDRGQIRALRVRICGAIVTRRGPLSPWVEVRTRSICALSQLRGPRHRKWDSTSYGNRSLKRTAPEYPGRGYSRSRPLKGKRACWVSSPSLSYALPGPAVKGPMDKRSPTNASADRFLPYSGITCMVAVPGTGPGIGTGAGPAD